MGTGKRWQGDFMFVDWNVEIKTTHYQELKQTYV